MRAGFVEEPRAHRLHVPPWQTPRHGLCERLRLGVSGPVTLVTAPAGWGKTVGVSAWASSAEVPGAVLWVSLAGTRADPDLFWKLFHEAFLAAGGRHVAPIPATGVSERRRLHALALLGTTLRRSGPWVLVVDDFPTGPVGGMGDDLEIVMDHARHGLRLVVLGRGEPALSVQRRHVAGELTRIGVADLRMNAHEVADVLAQHGVHADDDTTRLVERHTQGWPCAVRLAACALRESPSTEVGLDEADRATVEYLGSEVLARSPAHLHELIVRTSMVEEVSRDLAASVLGEDRDPGLDAGTASATFVTLGTDGSFRCHPLLRAAALAELDRRPLGEAREARRRVARWHLERGRTGTGLEIAMAGEDWSWMARALVEAYAVPRILEGTTTGVMKSALAVSGVCAEERLIEAALLLSRGGPDAAEAVLELISDRGEGTESVADQLSAIFVRLAVARARGDAATGLPLAARARALIAHLDVDLQLELLPRLEAHEGALELGDGDLDHAAATLRHGALGVSEECLPTTASLDCRGQLALLEAFLGNLRLAGRQATAVLRSASLQGCAGVAHAHLATAWIHLERGEPVLARQHLDRAADLADDAAEPWYGAAHLLTEAGFLGATDQPEAALRLLTHAIGARGPGGEGSEWTRGLLADATASALLATGEPRRALRLLAGRPGSSPVEQAVLKARALVELGDLAGAHTTLTGVEAGLRSAPLASQIECWLLSARLADQAGRSERARMLVDRALSEAGRELMRRPVAREASWLLPLVEHDVVLRRAHGGFLGGLRPAALAPVVWRSDPGQPAPMVVEMLTVREAQVLGLLSEMLSTEEIARELFLSVNTVKTYVRGILRKLAVNRRVDAVRRGRELGLC
jgi:LuxR family maltose regulon positive regulatory protein